MKRISCISPDKEPGFSINSAVPAIDQPLHGPRHKCRGNLVRSRQYTVGSFVKLKTENRKFTPLTSLPNDDIVPVK